MGTTSDFTGLGPYLVCALLAMASLSFALALAHHWGFAVAPLQMLYAFGGTILFSFFIVYDTQMIVGGDHKQEFSVDDYAMAAICLYMDIIQLFLQILSLLGSKDDDL